MIRRLTRNERTRGVVLTLALLTVFCAAQSEFAPKSPEVTAAPVGRVSIAPGTAVSVPITFRLSPGFHINSSVPRSELLIPTVLTLPAPSPEVSIRIIYPKGEDVAFEFEPDNKLSVYSGEFTITARIRAVRAAKPGVHTVRGTLKYQACNDRSCFPPKSLPVEFEVEVAKPASARAAATRR